MYHFLHKIYAQFKGKIGNLVGYEKNSTNYFFAYCFIIR